MKVHNRSESNAYEFGYFLAGTQIENIWKRRSPYVTTRWITRTNSRSYRISEFIWTCRRKHPVSRTGPRLPIQIIPFTSTEDETFNVFIFKDYLKNINITDITINIKWIIMNCEWITMKPFHLTYEFHANSDLIQIFLQNYFKRTVQKTRCCKVQG